MEIKILGSGCANCKTLFSRVEEAVRELKLQATVEKIEDIEEIITFGILATPGLVIDGVVVSQGRVYTITRLKELLLESQKRVTA